MKTHARSVLSLAAAGACGTACTPAAEDGFAGAPVVEGDTLLRFPSGAAHASGLRAEVRYVGRIEDAVRGPFLITSGVECAGCDAGRSVLLRSAHDAPDTAGVQRPGWYAYPGLITHFEGECPLFDSRLFWGAACPGAHRGWCSSRRSSTAWDDEPAMSST